jgi:3-hydroxyisobutyrate dehydrogenase-like beta-hydroxyacid dehydrogenase
LSVVPPHAAEDVAREVAGLGFHGLYLDANAIAPERAQRMDTALAAAGIDLVDGGIMGGPAWKPGTTRLALAGPRAAEIAAVFASSPLLTEDLGPEIGRASALKMCFAAYTKGTTALLCAVLAAAEQLGVRPALFHEWGRDDERFPEQAMQRARTVTAKAWRFAGEMEEIATTFRSAGLPGEFHAAASEIYQRLAEFKENEAPPPFEEVLRALAQPAADHTQR